MAAKSQKVPGKTSRAPVPAGDLWEPVASLRHEVDRLFDDFTTGFDLPFGRRGFDLRPFEKLADFRTRVPAVDVVEKKKAFEITAELPGLDQKDVDITLDEGVLTIRGEKKEQKEEDREGYHLSERRYGSFRRSFAVPDGVDDKKIDASFKNGVLTVKLPKKAAAAKHPAKKIDVKAR